MVSSGSGRPAIVSSARYGFSNTDWAEERLRAAGWWTDTGPGEAEPIVAALSRAPDPDLALHALDRLRDTSEEEWADLAAELADSACLRGRLIGVLGTSSAFGDHMVAHPKDWRRLRAWETSDELTATYTAELLAAVRRGTAGNATLAAEQAISALRGAYRAVLLDIASWDLAHTAEPELPVVEYEDVVTLLSDAAVAALRAAWAVAETEWWSTAPEGAETPRLAVIAMGKCGGRELNYVSDVDVVFVAGSESEVAGATRMATTLMRVVGAACFEVDAALRPEGKNGALVRSLDGHVAYYRRWARTWEFQALLKARPVAGDEQLGQEYADAVLPFVWTSAEREGFVSDVRSMRRRVEDHVPEDVADRELKVGRGGLRDVEFAVQLLQLVHGRTDESLRDKSTLNALRALGEGGYVARADVADLVESYRFLRVVEHRLQLRRLRRTHVFPPFDDEAALDVLARSAGMRSGRRSTASEDLVTEFRRHRTRVRRLHEKIFYRPLLESVAQVPTEALRLATGAASERLAALGYTSPEGALRHIAALTTGVSRRASIQGTLLPMLLDLFARTPDPDGALLEYRKVSEALAETPWYLRLLRDEGVVGQRLAYLLGTSRFVPELLVRAPEVLRLLVDTRGFTERDPAEIAESLHATVGRHQEPERAVTAARSLRRHELLRIACGDLLGLMPPGSVRMALSSIWVAVLEAALTVAADSVAERTGERPARIAVIGMGRLGGAELGYGSDADVMFVCEPSGGASESVAVRYATAVVERVRSLLGAPSQDPALEVDIDLRPEGKQGALVRTVESYRSYYERWAHVWEAQALLRARPIAGDGELGERFRAMIDPIRYPEGGLDAAKSREIRRIKARVDAERLPRGADPAMHTKLGRGGLADVEWALQLLQLQHAHRHPELQTPSTVAGLRSAAEAGVLSETDAERLVDAWSWAMRVRNAVTLVRGKPGDQLPKQGRELSMVAVALGYSAGTDLGTVVDDYLRVTRRARAVVERVFYES
ncbi:bifunctional [glutamine synthetase] adenylyltransferase/[glutamine synthetase]-adenylyl-L-tyrosine phosphorylase [Salinifilum ghardaiensis]